MWRTFRVTYQWYTICLLVCAFFGVSYIGAGIIFLFNGFIFIWYSIGIIFYGVLILVSVWFAYKGHEGAGIFLIIMNFGNLISMAAGFMILQYLQSTSGQVGVRVRRRPQPVRRISRREQRIRLQQRRILDEQREIKYLEEKSTEKIETSNTKICEFCGKPTPAHRDFCLKCGKSFEPDF